MNGAKYIFSPRNTPNAIDDFSAAIDLDEHNKNAYLYRGYCYTALNQYDEAIESFKRYISFDPTNAAPYSEIAKSYLQLEDYQTALTWYDRAWQRDQTSQNLLLGKALCYANTGQYEKSISIMKQIAYEKTTQTAPQNDPTHSFDPEQIVAHIKNHEMTDLYQQGITKMNAKQYDQAIENFTKIIEISNTRSQAFYFRGLSYYYQGLYQKKNLFASQKDTTSYELALQDLLTAHSLEPDNMHICVEVGNLYFSLGQWKQSIQFFKKAIALNPQSSFAVFAVGYTVSSQYGYPVVPCVLSKSYNL